MRIFLITTLCISHFALAQTQSHFTGPKDGAIGFSDDGRPATIRILARNKDTRGHFSVMEHLMPPGYDGPGFHVHKKIVKSLYAISGKVDVHLLEKGKKRVVHMAPGSFLAIAPGVPHTFKNPYAKDAKVLGIDGPGDLVLMFEQMATLDPKLSADEKKNALNYIRKQKFDNVFTTESFARDL